MPTLSALLLSVLLPGAFLAAAQGKPTNPVFAGADPHAVRIGSKIWVYPTRHGQDLSFSAFSSADLKTWTDHGPVLRFADVKWIKDDGQNEHYPWAPAIAIKDGKFYFYYSVGPQGATPSRIGVAVGTSPQGPFVDSGKPLLTGGNGFEAIDPMVFIDSKSERAYLYAGGSAGAKLRVFELTEDMTRLRREIPVQTPPNFTEGAFMHERNGVYYLSYSHGGWRDSSYSVHYATSDSPTGPWQYRGVILSSDAHHKGPGHHSFFRGPGREEWYIAYHRWNNAKGDGPYNGERQVAIDVLRYDGMLILPVQMTDFAPPYPRPNR